MVTVGLYLELLLDNIKTDFGWCLKLYWLIWVNRECDGLNRMEEVGYTMDGY